MLSENDFSYTAQRTDLLCPPFSLILPVYNEERLITQTLDYLHNLLKSSGCIYEIIAVNDGSTDETSRILRSRGDTIVLEHGMNRGYGAALKTGIRSAKHPLIAITDADGIYPNERLTELVSLAVSADMVVAARTGIHTNYSSLRRIPKWFLVRFAEWISRSRIPDLNSGMRVFRKSIVERFLNILPDTFGFSTTLTLAMLTNHYKVHYEPIDFHHRVSRTKVNPIRDTLRFIQLILRVGVYFSPLRVFLPIAAIFFGAFLITVSQDIFLRGDLTERSLILFVTATQLGMFALLADMIDKRT